MVVLSAFYGTKLTIYIQLNNFYIYKNTFFNTFISITVSNDCINGSASGLYSKIWSISRCARMLRIFFPSGV